MARAKVALHSAGMVDLLHDPGVRAHLTAMAEQVATAARASAPVASGAYRDSIRVEQATTDRAVVRVVASDPKSLIIEAKTGNLARALDGADGLVDYVNKQGKKSRITQAQADNYNRRKSS